MLRAYSTRTMKKRESITREEVTFHTSFQDISSSEIVVPQQEIGTTADIARNPARMQRSGSCKGAPASADGIRAAQAYDPRRQGAFAGNRREKRSPPSDGGDTRRGIVGCETPVKRQAVEPDAEVFMQQWECFESVRRSYRSTLQEDIQTWFRTLRL